MPSSVRAPVIAVGVTFLEAPFMSKEAAREHFLLRKPLSETSLLYTCTLESGWGYLLIYPYGARAVRQRVGFDRC